MDTKTAFVASLQPPAPIENPAVGPANSNGENQQFKNMLEEASHNVKPSGDNTSEKNDSQNESAYSSNQSSTGQSPGVAKPDQQTAGNPDPGNKESFDSHLTPTPNDQAPVQEGTGTLPNYKNALVEKLQSLGVSQEKIDALLNLLALDTTTNITDATGVTNATDTTSAEKSIAALADLLGVTPNAVQGNFLPDPQKGGEPASPLNAQERLVVAFLRQSGLSEAESNNFLQKMIRVTTNELKPQGAREGNNKPDATDVVRLAHTPAQENAGEVINKLVQQQKLKPQQQETAGKITSGHNVASTEKAPTQDSLVKTSNPTHPPRQNPAGENTVQATLLSVSGPRNSQDSISTPDANPAKISAELVNQADSPAAEKSALSGKQVAREAPLPRGVTENNLMEQIVRKFSIRGAGAKSEIHIRLEPPSLGIVRMNISTTGDTMKTTIIAENHAVRQTIESNLSQLKDSLAQQGVVVENLDVLVGGNPGPPGQNQNQPTNRQADNSPLEPPADQETAEPIISESHPSLFAGTAKINVFA